MTSRLLSCSGCLVAIKGRRYLKCCVCNSAFDLQCADISEKTFTSNSFSLYDWKCGQCKDKVSKSDISNTPIADTNVGTRPETATSSLEPEPLTEIQSWQQLSHSERSYDQDMITAIKDQIIAAVKQELPSILAAVMKSELEPIKNDIQLLKGLQRTVVTLSDNQKHIEESVNALTDENNKLRNENFALHSALIDVSERLNNMEQHLRDNNLEIHGIPEHRSENIQSVLQQCANVVNCQLNTEDVINCTRVAKLNKDSKQPRTIVVKFKSVGRRDEFYSAVQRYNKTNPNEKLNTNLLGYSGDKIPVYIAEHLSPLNKSLHAEARKRAKMSSFKFVWVRNGRIYVRKDATSQYILIKNSSSLDLIK